MSSCFLEIMGCGKLNTPNVNTKNSLIAQSCWWWYFLKKILNLRPPMLHASLRTALHGGVIRDTTSTGLFCWLLMAFMTQSTLLLVVVRWSSSVLTHMSSPTAHFRSASWHTHEEGLYINDGIWCTESTKENSGGSQNALWQHKETFTSEYIQTYLNSQPQI